VPPMNRFRRYLTGSLRIVNEGDGARLPILTRINKAGSPRRDFQSSCKKTTVAAESHGIQLRSAYPLDPPRF